MDLDLEEELNWFAEDPLDIPVTSPQAPPPLKHRPSTQKIKSTKSISQKSKIRDDENEEVASESKQTRPEEIPLAKSPSDLLGKVARSPSEKLSLLEERDKLMRIKWEKEEFSAGKPSAKGFCPDMCPEKERLFRDVRGIFALHEASPDSNTMDHSRAVKEYTRSSADQEEPLPHELRPTPVLRMTMDYLIVEIMQKLDQNDSENVGNWYDFCWGRLRAIRKDIIQQQLCNLNTVAILEECARFHICCFDRLWGSSNSVFDDKMNSETLMNCLKSLLDMYKDLRKQGKSCPNEAEFYAYMVLLKLHSGFVLSEFNSFPLSLQKSANVKEAIEIHSAYSNNMYPTYFKLSKKTTYLNACLMQRFFGHVRTRALEIIVKSHCPPRQHIKLSVSYLAQTLKFDKLEDCITFCTDFGLSLENDNLHFKVSRNDFYFPETMFTESTSSSLVVNKRVLIAQSVLGQKELPKIYKHEIHSSFNAEHFLNSGALDASDQEEKMLRDTVKRSVLMNKKAAETDEVQPVEVVETMETAPSEPMEVPETIISDAETTSDLPYVDEESAPSSVHQSELSMESESSDSEETDSHFEMESVVSIGDQSNSDSSSSFGSSLVSSHDPPEQIASSPFQSQHVSPEAQKTPELKKSPLKISHQTSGPFFTFSQFKPSTQKTPETPTEVKTTKREKVETPRVTQKAKAEVENSVIMAKLRKKLSENMKHVDVKKYAHMWREKVEKVRRNRQNKGSFMRHITLDEYIQLWGAVQVGSKCKTLDRLRKRNRANLLVVALLHSNIIDRLDSKVNRVGVQIANILSRVSIKWADHFGNVAQPQPVFWKLVLSLPHRIPEGEMFFKKLRIWSRTAFDKRIDSETSDVCCYVTSCGIPVFIHVVITEGVDQIENHAHNLSAAVLIRADGWESEIDSVKRLKSLISMTRGSMPLAVLTLGNQMEPLNIDKDACSKLSCVQHALWVDSNTFASSLMRLAENHHMDNLKVQPLGILIEMAIERFLDSLHQDRFLLDKLSDSLCAPNFIIRLYNSLINKLQNEISQCTFYNFFGLACELEPLVKKLKYSHDIFPSNYENTETFKAALDSLLKNSPLAPFPWKFSDSIGLLAEFKGYCSDMGFPQLLPQLIRLINPPDSDSGEDLLDYLKDVRWLQIVETLAKGRIDKKAYSFKVVYREDKIKDLSTSHWWLKSEL